MATLSELFDIRSNNDLLKKITSACAKAAETIRNESAATTNHANRLIWAKQAFADPRAKAGDMIWALLAANAGATVANITGASDSAIQSNVDAAVDIFADGG